MQPEEKKLYKQQWYLRNKERIYNKPGYKEITVKCPHCGEDRTIKKRHYRGQDQVCSLCALKLGTEKRQNERLDPQEKHLRHIAYRYKYRHSQCGKITRKKWFDSPMAKQYKAEWQRRYRQSPLVRLRNSLSTMLLMNLGRFNYIYKPGRTFQLLGYNGIDFNRHISSCFERGCVICGKPIGDKWHLAHLTPVKNATNTEELYRLFRLDNLAIAHPICNLRAGTTDLRLENQYHA
jgi:hypothetical protein